MQRAPTPFLPMLALAVLMSAFASLPVEARSSRLPGTGGVQQLEGAAGGGLTPWALIAGLGSNRALGGSGYFTRVEVSDFRLDSYGVAAGLYDRVELSLARMDLDIDGTVPGESLRADIAGVKLRVLGDAIYDQDTWLPQLAVGLQYKRSRDFDFIPAALGARDRSGIDAYASATKLWLGGAFGRNLLLSGTLRATRANQLGLLGFGGDLGGHYRWMPELSAAVFLHERLAVGAEYRRKPDQLGVFREHAFSDVFVAWIPDKHASVTLARVDLGNIADKPQQRGWYLSVQLVF